MENMKFYSLKQIGEILGFSVITIREWIKAGKMGATKIGNSYRVTQDQLDEFLKGDK